MKAVPEQRPRRTAMLRAARRRRVERIAGDQAGIASRIQVYAAGVTRYEVRENIRAGRWQRVGRQSIAVYTGPLTDASRDWAAVFEAGPRGFLDGASALRTSGLKKFEVDRIRVSVPRGARVRRARGIDVRQTRRWSPDDLLESGSGVPRARVEVAAIRGALWARSDKQAALLLTMVIQQGLTTAERLGAEMLRVKRDRRRAFLNTVILDLLGGVRSLGEFDVARELRRRGLPEPTRQVLRKGRNGTYYLDIFWDDWGIVVEIDGIHHTWAQNVVSDALRQNDVTLDKHTMLRLPLLGLRVAADEFFEQIERALRGAGWQTLDDTA
jgi:very-short-patch-repair endonuclease